MKLSLPLLVLSSSFLLISPEISAQYISSNVTQAGNPVVYPGNTNQLILRIEIEIGPNPVTLTNMEFNTNGSTNPPSDITTFKLYYYNDSSSFNINMANFIGTFVNPWVTNFMFLTAPNANYTGMSSFSGMNTGKNYFWLLYDLSAGAFVCNYVDAELIDIDLSGGNPPPAQQSPPGNSIIGPCPIGISENSANSIFSIFPVPASDEITLEFDKPIINPIIIELLDVTGKLVSSLFNGQPEGTITSLKLSLKSYEPGLYLIRSTYDGRESLSKIVLF